MDRFIPTEKKQKFDLLVIGGGISGCAIAYQAASCGLSVVLVEKKDFGHATSSATSKLIHGGLRYLKNYEFGLVRESLHERRVLGNIAPNLVRPLRFLLVNKTQGLVKDMLFRLGLSLYDLLSYDKTWVEEESNKLLNHNVISKKELLKEEPEIQTKDIQGAISYYDYQNINPDRMTFSFLQSAVEKGAMVSNYMEVKQIIIKGDEVKGATVYDKIHDKQHDIHAKFTINCTGPWSDFILKKTGLAFPEKGNITRSEGVHLITRPLTHKNAVLFTTDEGDHLMLLPWRGHTIIGTNDKPFLGNPDDYKVQKESIEEILFKVNKYFLRPEEALKPRDILLAYGGLRPLASSNATDSYNASRKYEILDNEDTGLRGMITVEGGKYTTSRKLAENVLKLLKNKGLSMEECKTGKIALVGCRKPNTQKWIEELMDTYGEIFSKDTYHYYAANYGEQAKKILDLAKENNEYRKRISVDGEILAEAVHALQNELVYTLQDVFLRRTGIGTIGRPTEEVIQLVSGLAKENLHWSEERLDEELRKLEEYYRNPIVEI